MRTFVVLTLVAACAEEPAPVAMSLADGDHVPLGQVEVHVTLRDHHTAGDPALAIDGEAPAFEVTTVPLTQDFGCPECADFLLRWPAVEVSAGRHVVKVSAGTFGSASADVTFDNDPVLRRIEPSSIADLEGVGHIDFRFGVISRDPAATAITLDGAPLAQTAAADCRTECEIVQALDTATPSAGHHTLIVAATAGDSAGMLNVPLELKDAVQVRGLELSSVSLDLGLTAPDIEVYVFDETDNHKMLGCAPPGAFPGVTQAHVHYDLTADLISANSGVPLFEELRNLPADHQLRFEVWEDDDGMECPAPPDPDRPDANADDFLGRSTPMTMASWRTAAVQSFGQVDAFQIVVGRPLVR